MLERIERARTEPPFGNGNEEQVPSAAVDAYIPRPAAALLGRDVAVRPARSDPPRMALRLFSAADQAHYAREWGAHLAELVADGEHRQARKDRRRLLLRAPWFAFELRLRALVRRRSQSSR